MLCCLPAVCSNTTPSVGPIKISIKTHKSGFFLNALSLHILHRSKQTLLLQLLLQQAAGIWTFHGGNLTVLFVQGGINRWDGVTIPHRETPEASFKARHTSLVRNPHQHSQICSQETMFGPKMKLVKVHPELQSGVANCCSALFHLGQCRNSSATKSGLRKCRRALSGKC